MDTSLNQLTYEKFKKDIMTFTLKPGEPISAAKIAERYNVSRTPAREALVKLEAEGLVDIFPQSKSMISRINGKRAREEWFIRKTLEIGMVDAFFDNVTKNDIEEMRGFASKMAVIGQQPRNHESSYEYLVNDNRFHAVTYRVAGEDLAAEVISTTMAHYNRVRLLIDLDNIHKDRTVADHDKMISLIESGDREGYRQTLTEHLLYIVTDLEEMESLNPNLFN